MKTLNVIARIRGINIVLGDETPSIGTKDTVHSEATGETRDTPKNRLECLLHVVIGVIFKDWEKKKEEEEEECVLVQRSLSPNQPSYCMANDIYIYDSYIQLTLQHCDETLILILHTGFSAKS